MKSISFKPGTQPGPFSASEMESFARMMKVDYPTFAFDESYARFIESNRGGVPVENMFRLEDGWCPIDRFLNFADGGDDLLFNVHQTWNLIEDRLDAGQFPFAALPGGDFLILDHRSSVAPQVMMWCHEKSRESSPHLLLVAMNFEEFVDRLRPVHAEESDEKATA